MERPRCPQHGLILGEGGCIRCRRDADRGTGRVLLGVLIGIVALVIVGMGIVRAATAIGDHLAAKRAKPEIVATSEPPPVPSPPSATTNAPTAATTEPTTAIAATAPTSTADDREERIRAEMRNVSVTLYSADYCPWCRKAKAHMSSRGISYTERRIDQSPEAKREMNRIGGDGIPTFDIEGEVHSGFNPAWIDRVVRSHAERRAARP